VPRVSRSKAAGEREIKAISRHVGELWSWFAQLEWIAHMSVRVLSKDQVLGQEAADREFTPRVRTLIALSKERVATEVRAEWIKLWKEVLALARHRNNIFHSPTLVSVLLNPETEETHVQVNVHTYRGTSQDKYDAAAIKKHAKEAKKLCGEVMKLFSSVFPPKLRPRP
jgi:hypothetical protein